MSGTFLTIHNNDPVTTEISYAKLSEHSTQRQTKKQNMFMIHYSMTINKGRSKADWQTALNI